MEAREICRLLVQLLEDSGAAWSQSDGCICFRLRRGGAVWETACRCLDGRLLVYGRYPFAAGDRARALARCSEINRQVICGAMFLDGDGRPVFRTDAALPDVYDARGRAAWAIEYNAAVLRRFWHRLAPESTL